MSYSNTARHRFKIRGAEVGIDGKQNHFVGGQVFLGGEAGRQTGGHHGSFATKIQLIFN